MKLVVLMCIEEYTDDARNLLKDIKIPAYSEAPMRGFTLQENNEGSNWFVSNHKLDNSRIFFSMCSDDKADELMKAVDNCRIEKEINNVHAFQLSIEKYIG